MTEAPAPDAEQPYYQVARQKLVVMSLTTLSLYQIYWFYRNFQRMNARTGGGGSPFWRAVAAPLTGHALFAHVRADAQSRFITVTWSALGIAVIYFSLAALCFFEYPWWLLALGSVFALLPVHATMEQVNRKVAPLGPSDDGYSVLNIICIVLGVALTIGAVYLTRMEEQFVEQLLEQL